MAVCVGVTALAVGEEERAAASFCACSASIASSRRAAAVGVAAAVLPIREGMAGDNGTTRSAAVVSGVAFARVSTAVRYAGRGLERGTVVAKDSEEMRKGEIGKSGRM